jgi:hypothetical protein
MKTTRYLLILLTCVMLASCNFSAGTKKDFTTGLSYTHNGFQVDNVLLVGPDNIAMSNNEVQLNTKVAISVEGLANYELKDGKAYPGFMLSVTDKNGASVIGEADLFATNEGYSAEDASVLRGTITVGDPMTVGETYSVKVKVWDKNKPENELTAEVNLVVK